MSWARRRRRWRVRWRRARRGIVTGALLLVLLVSGVLLAASAMVQRSPNWWRRVDAADPRTIQSAQDVENGLTTLFHMDREPDAAAGFEGRPVSEEWRFAIRAVDANAWLNTRLPAWLTRREDLSAWPDEIGQIQVDFNDGIIHVGVEVEASPGIVRILSADVRPQVREDGSLWLPAELVRVGTLPLPAGAVLRTARRQANAMVPVSIRQTADADLLWKAFLGEGAVAVNPTVRLPDGRRVRILGLRAHRGTLEVRCRTEWAATAPIEAGHP